MKNLIFPFLFLLLTGTVLQSQEISVIHIQGDAKTNAKSEKKSGWVEKTINLSYGPLKQDQKLILNNKATVKLIRDDGSQCELQGPGTFEISDLKFEKIEEKSTLNTFMDYFKSFFVAHPNSESKENYSNSISAISRGEMVMPPLLSFPFPGALPLLKKEINFSWEVSCDTCTYNLIIKDLSGKKIVLQKETNKHNFTLTHPEKYFELNKKYLWWVEIKHSDAVAVSQLFTINDFNDYQSRINEIEKSLGNENSYLNPVTKMISVFSALEKDELTNYMILYGQEQMKKYPKDAAIRGIYNRVYYDNLKRKRI